MAYPVGLRIMATKSQENPGFVTKSRMFVDDVRTETEKVTWPSREDLKASTSVTLVFLLILAGMIGGMDVVFQNVVLWLYRIF